MNLEKNKGESINNITTQPRIATQPRITAQPTLDYSLQTPAERVALVARLPLQNSSPHMLENCANYILHAADKALANHKAQNNAEAKKSLELGTITDNDLSAAPPTPRKGSNAYTYKREAVPWENKQLNGLLADIEQLEKAGQGDQPNAYKLRKWALELRIDARARLSEHRMNTHPTFTAAPEPNLEMAGLDWTNAFHIKHVVRHYSELRQSEHSKWEMEYFEQIVEKTSLLPWQKHLFIRYIDGAHSIVVARELGDEFGKMVAPGYTSKLMRQIYRQIAEQAEREDIVRQKGPTRKCVRCGKTYPDHSFWWRKGQSACKQCLGKKQ